MRHHILVYIKRRLGDGRGSPSVGGNFAQLSLRRPAGHGFGQRWLLDLGHDGGLVIWLFSIMRYGKLCLPPSLDACIAVKHCYSRDHKGSKPPYINWLLRASNYRYAFEADENRSFYLPWNNATSILRRIVERPKAPVVGNAVLRFSRYSEVMTHFQTPRRVEDKTADTLGEFARELTDRPEGFVSYRRAESPIWAMQAAAQLYHQGVAPWWDQWAMPRKVAEEQAMLRSASLRAEVNEAIHRARFAVSLCTSSYGQSPWTEFEFKLLQAASARGRLEHIQIPVCGDTRTDVALAKRTLRSAIRDALKDLPNHHLLGV
jgi:hypothetical protein